MKNFIISLSIVLIIGVFGRLVNGIYILMIPEFNELIHAIILVIVFWNSLDINVLKK